MSNKRPFFTVDSVDEKGERGGELSRSRPTWFLWFVRGVTFSYFLFMLLMLLHPDPWSLFGIHRLPEVLNGFFSVVHFLIFVVLAFGVECGRIRWSRSCWVVILLIVGPSLEGIQNYTGRSFEWIDLVENISGILCGTLLGAVFCRNPLFRRWLGKGA